jgi:hypothetical protein
VLIFNFSEVFLYNVFHGYHSCRAAKLIYNDCNLFLLFNEHFQNFIGLHGLRYDGNGTQDMLDMGGFLEEFVGVNISDDVVDVITKNQDFGKSCFDKSFPKIINAVGDFNGHDLVARY